MTTGDCLAFISNPSPFVDLETGIRPNGLIDIPLELSLLEFVLLLSSSMGTHAKFSPS